MAYQYDLHKILIKNYDEKNDERTFEKCEVKDEDCEQLMKLINLEKIEIPYSKKFIEEMI